MRTPAGEGPSGPRPALRLSPGPVADARPDDARPCQPIPAETLVLQRDGATYITRSWDDREEAVRDCHLCPKGVCRVSPRGNCMVRIEGFVPTALAALRPMTSPGLGLAAVSGLGPGLGRHGSGG